MSQENNIDDLFRSKLAGREVGYSASAWSGASAMLDTHFKWLFIRRALYILLPIVVISGIGVLFNLQDSAGYSARTSDTEYQPMGEFNGLQPTDSVQEQLAIASIVSEAEQPNRDRTNETSSTNEYLIADKEEMATTSSAPATEETEITSVVEPVVQEPAIENTDISITETNSQGMLEFEDDINPYKHPSVSTELASLKLKSNIDYMPIAGFDDEYTFDLLERNSANPLLSQLRKIQLFAEGGVLLAQTMNRTTSSIPGVGLHARLLLKYHLGESVYLDFGLGAFNRNSLPDGQPFGGSGVAASLIQINPQWLNYGSIMLGTGYRIGARHALGIGFEFNPLLWVNARRSETILVEGTSTESWAIDDTGISSFDAAFVANYRFSIAERLDATSELHVGFIDATDDNIFDPTAGSNNNTLVKLGLSYRLTNR